MRSGPKYNSVQGLIDFREKSTPNQITPEDSNSDVCVPYRARVFNFSDGGNQNLRTSFEVDQCTNKTTRSAGQTEFTLCLARVCISRAT